MWRSDDANADAVVDRIRSARADLAVVVGWNQILKPPVLVAPRHGCVGFHASMLPRNRGHAPVNWAILRGEQSTGNTMMVLDPGVDTGDIVEQQPVPIGPDDTVASVYSKVGRAGAAMLSSHLGALLEGSAPRRPQPRDGATVLPRRTPEMGVIDWSLTVGELHDWVRALTWPYPGAFTSLAGQRVHCWSARPEPGPITATPGTVVGIGPRAVRVAAADGVLAVRTMSHAGEPVRTAGPWARRCGLRVGDVFDSVPADVSHWARHGGPRPRQGS